MKAARQVSIIQYNYRIKKPYVPTDTYSIYLFHKGDGEFLGDSVRAMNTQLVIIVHMINKVNNVSHGSEGKEYDIDSEIQLDFLSVIVVVSGFAFKAHVRTACTSIW